MSGDVQSKPDEAYLHRRCRGGGGAGVEDDAWKMATVATVT